MINPGNLKKGFLRLWLVASAVWIFAAGYNQYKYFTALTPNAVEALSCSFEYCHKHGILGAECIKPEAALDLKELPGKCGYKAANNEDLIEATKKMFYLPIGMFLIGLLGLRPVRWIYRGFKNV